MSEALTVPLNIPGVLAERPDFLKEGFRGTENINPATDIRPPALRIAQDLSPQIKRTKPEFIEGLKVGEFFNTMSKKIYGEGPVYFLVINQLGHRNMILRPLKDGGGIIESNVPDTDPRTKWGKKGEKPQTTTFYDYLVGILNSDGKVDIATFSLKSTQIKHAKDLNTWLLEAKLDSWAQIWSATVIIERKGPQEWFGWKFQPAGWANSELTKKAEEAYNLYSGKTPDDLVDVEEAATSTRSSDEDEPF